MPHQCLACGNIIPNGSPEILKGCSSCGGKKFFYITKPVSTEEREDILHKVEKERELILSKSEMDVEKYMDEFINKVKSQKKRETMTDEQIQDLFKEAFVQVRERNAGRSKGRDLDKYIETPKVQVVRDLDLGRPRGGEKPDRKPSGGEKPDKKPKGGRKQKGQPKSDLKSYKDTVKGNKEKLKDARRDGKKTPEVINVVETGVYEIDVQAIMEGKPIIVQQDGTYLIHLPSLFERLDKKKKRKAS